MPARIPLSHVKALGFDFVSEVAKHRQDIADWAARPADWDMIPAPAPLHPLVATAVTVGSYEIVDDAPPPPPPPSIEERKHALADKVRQALAVANAGVLPSLKRPLLELQTRTAAEKRWEDRTQGDREILNTRKVIEQRLAANELAAAHELAAIADLTEETVGGYVMPVFPDAPPVDAPSIEERRAALAADVESEAARRVAAVQHPLKRELLDLQAVAALVKPEDQRTDADRQALAERGAIDAKVDAIKLHAARLKAAIAELDEVGLASFKLEPFPA